MQGVFGWWVVVVGGVGAGISVSLCTCGRNVSADGFVLTVFIYALINKPRRPSEKRAVDR